MSRGNDFRAPRKRGYDDDFTPPSYSPRRDSAPPRSGGGSFNSPPTGPIVDATVKWFNPEKGFGFVEVGDGSGDAFLHINALQNAGHEAVAPGTRLRVQVGQGQKGAQVTNVIEVDASTATAGGGSSSGGPRSSPRPPRVAVDPSRAVEVSGTVKWFNAEKGFGFVTCQDGGKDVFVHTSIVSAAGLSGLGEGEQVTMRVVDTPKGREAVSINVDH
jgi:CspA family cold shock protein